MSLGLYVAGGLAAAQYLGVYLIVTIYAGITFSSRACLMATAAATASYVAILMLQHAGILSAPFDLPNAATIAAFNLVILNIAGALTAILARALRDSRRRLRATAQELERFVEAIPDVIYVLDRAGRLSLWNRKLESVTGRGAEDLKGKPLIDLLAEDDRDAFRAALAAGLDDKPFEVECRLGGADGALTAYQWTGAALTDEHGQVSGLTGVGRDVTERQRAEEVLRQRESEMRQLQKIEAIGRLAGGVAHDFNNVLTVVIGRCQLLLARYQPEDPVYHDLDQIESTAQRAASLTRQLLAFSRNQASAQQPLDLNTTVTSVSDMLGRLIGENIQLAVTLDPTLDLVTADPGQIEQVIVNFAVNARDAMPDGGRLSIATRNITLNAEFVSVHPGAIAGPHVLLEVRDTGLGMDEETRQRAFEPFFTTKAPGKGCGLGLSTVYGIIKQHGGCIAVESAPGRGAAFSVYLPRIEAAIEAPRVDAGRGPFPGGEETILIAEDEEAVRGLVCEILRRLGYRVLVAGDGVEALALSQRFPDRIHLLLTDVIMPGMDGRELAERMLAVRPDTRTLFMSGYAEPPIPDDVLLQKPVTPDALARKVAEVLRQPAPHRRDAVGAGPALAG
jgi:PAS domain S-box-containing protein